jgi:hypothetical protein
MLSSATLITNAANTPLGFVCFPLVLSLAIFEFTIRYAQLFLATLQWNFRCALICLTKLQPAFLYALLYLLILQPTIY